MAITITVGNYKGGVGKTTNAVLNSYEFAKKGKRTLLVDLDPQSNATKSLMLTKSILNPDEKITLNKTLMKGIQEGNLDGLEVEITENLYLIPSYVDFQDFAKFLYKSCSSEEEEDFYFKGLLEKIKHKYDYIFIDVPPMSIEVTKNAVVASDYVLITLQTQERSLTGAENYINQLIKLKEQYDLDIEVVGILPVLLKNNGKVDEYIMENAREIFGEENLFENIVPQMERIKRFDVNGITENDRHDLNVIELYEKISDELLSRINVFESMKVGV
ncbi:MULTISPECIES: ParA family protein [Bacillus]|uniref:ParA family protein n=1 Tax=Bacillus TaxID=1386 RepID=UPI000B4A35EA|nr:MULTISPECIES: ParA family protein [Bacillus]MDH4423985.1 ParA family protein [Bacillus cereus]PGL74483.1 ParA family protein [Bacillus sp. AFS054943]PGX01391.1 ParA family protein [Bacillus sp. AFS033286]PGZ67306.1 ParA family protein [Bacillus sp. AFS029637]